ncbi:probable cAMP-dependent protein kinase catalytic subunit isoform X2 [Zootermopsis nevadensis]|uniref:probable cAMP-dependent protein kinase catalytic subunit isoform X2 n=1 Tax=Zootermopsis nevadensis TaxID=136037 RepID=UPI000B8EA63F|nr:probable cAMP-dependent protein kinase catalytic subunit isoform X2 [Zootermopsis nevadensis]
MQIPLRPTHYCLFQCQESSKIVCDTIDIPTWLSPDVADLVWNLLDKKPHCRLGALDIKWHPFFDGLKWGDVMAKKYQMPRPPPRRPVGSIASSQIRDSIFNRSEDNYEIPEMGDVVFASFIVEIMNLPL